MKNELKIAGLLIVLSFSLLFFLLALAVFKELSKLRIASSDNIQWTLSQAEYELLQLNETLYDQLFDPQADLQEIRRDFDIFYSRVVTLSEGQLYGSLMQSEEYASNIKLMQQFLTRNVSLIDATDEVLASEVLHLLDEVHTLRPFVRKMAIAGLSFSNEQEEMKRQDVRRVLTGLALVSFVLLFSLMFLLAFLLRENRRKHEQAARISAAYGLLDTIVNTSLDAIIVANTYGEILRVNRAAEDIFGWSAEYFQAKTMSETIIPQKYRDAHNKGMERLRAKGEKRVVGKGLVKLEAQKADGTIFPVEMSIQEGSSEFGVIYVASLRDISKREAAEKELVQARDKAIAGEKAMTSFIAVMSHEIRTPLNGILGTLALMHDTSMTPKQQSYIKNMETSGAVLLRHINDVLDVTKYDADHVAIDLCPVDIDVIVQSVVDNQTDLAALRSNTIEWHWCTEPTRMVVTDPKAFWQVLMNLVGNAVKFTSGGAISIELDAIETGLGEIELDLRVIDTGVGIDPKDIDRMFQDFERADKSYGRTSDGSGLGLGIARRIVHALGGEIGAESEIGEGSVFWVRLPMKTASDPNGVEASHPENAPLSKHKKSVLIVEDSDINREMLRDMIEADGHVVSEAANGLEGVRSAAARRFDLILLDISMPIMDGVEAIGKIRASNGPKKHTTIIATTAHAMPSELERFRKAGFTDYLQKPIDRKKLRQFLAAEGHAEAGGETPDLVKDLGPEKARELMSRFVLEGNETVAFLTSQKPEDLDLEEIEAKAHRLAGIAANFGFSGLRHSLHQVEHAAVSKATAKDLSAAIATVQSEWATVVGLINQSYPS